MAKVKDTPNLPASSKLQPPSGNGGTDSLIKETAGMNRSGIKGATHKTTVGAKSTGFMKKNPYC